MAKRYNPNDDNGNAMAAAAAVEREMLRFSQVFYRSDTLFARLYENDVDVQRISVMFPNLEREGYMAVASAVVGGKWYVAFHGGTSLGDALKGLMERLENGSIKWNPDKYKK